MRDLAFQRGMKFGRRRGTPRPPNPGAVLFDWDPAWNPYADRVGGLAGVPTGTAPTRSVTNGLLGMTFGGAGCLQFAGAPFAALSDLTGGVSMYVVCERTDAAVAQDGLICLDDNDGTTSSANHLIGTWDGGDTVSCLAYDGAGVSTIDSQAGATRNATQILSYHATTTARTAKINGTGSAEASGTTRDPGSLSRVTVGAYTLFVASGAISYFTGAIYRVLICEGAYDADVLTYLQTLYP